jgi:phosphatidylglycerophosphate synthase
MEIKTAKPIAYKHREIIFASSVFCVGLLFLYAGYVLLQRMWITDHIIRWIFAGILTLFIIIWRILIAFLNEPQTLPDAHFPGLANYLTIFRGLLICGLTGFIFLTPPEVRLGWIPGSLYIAVLMMDCLDGYVARLRSETSIFGEFLDRDFDALGTLIGVILAAHYAKVPDWYVIVGVAYYVFTFGGWLRKKIGRPLYPLPASRYRRYISVLQSVFIATAILPLPKFPEVKLLAILLMVLVLASFLRDWRFITGYHRPALS